MGTLLKIFLNCFGIILIAFGTLTIFAPGTMKQNIFSKLKKVSFKKLSVIAFTFGILFFLSASYCRYRLFIIALGIISFIKGISIIVFTEKMKRLTDRFLNAGDNGFRAFGFLYIAFGVVLLKGI